MALRRELNCEAVIHMDPIVTDDGVTSELREKVADLVKTVDERITIHDFRMVPGNSHTNLIFDAVVPYDMDMSVQEVASRIRQLVRDMDSNYFAVVMVEHPYIK